MEKRAALIDTQPVVENGDGHSVVVNIRDGLTDGAFIKDRFLVNQARHECGGADLVDAAGDALGVFENALQGIVGKEGACLVPCDLRLVLDVADGFLQVEWAEVVAHRQALVEGLVNREMESATEIGMADQGPPWRGADCPSCR